MLIFVRIETHAVIFSGISVRIVDLASEAFWSHFVRIGTRHFGQNLAKSVRIGTRDPLGMSWVLLGHSSSVGNAAIQVGSPIILIILSSSSLLTL